MKNNGERLVENDAPSFNLSDFDDSPSPPKTVMGHVNEEKVSVKGGVDDSGFGSSYTEMKNHKQQVDDDVPSFSVAPKSVMNDDKFSSEKGDDGEDGVYHDDISYKSSSTEKVHSKVTYEDELPADEKCEMMTLLLNLWMTLILSMKRKNSRKLKYKDKGGSAKSWLKMMKRKMTNSMTFKWIFQLPRFRNLTHRVL